MTDFPPGFIRQYEPLAEFRTAQAEAATAMYRSIHRLPHRLGAPSLIHPLFRQKAEERRATMPGNAKRGAGSVDALSLLDPADAAVLLRTNINSLEMTRSEDDEPTILTRDTLIDLFDTDLLIIATDRTTLLRVVGLLDGTGDGGDKGNKLAKFVEWASSNRLSSHVAVLTDAMTQRLNAPVGMHTGKIEHWAKAFGVDVDTWDGLWALLRHCTADGALNQTQVTCYSAIAHDTSYGLDKMWHHVSNDAANSLFFLSRNVEKARSASMACDPIRVQEALRTGDACQIAPLIADWPMTCAVSGPTRLKPNAQYAVFDKDMDKLGHVTVTGLGVDTDTQTVMADLAKPSGGLGKRLLDAATTGEVLILVEKLFLDSPSSRSVSPWAKGTPVPAVLGRQVPLAVLLAGTPTG